MKELRLAVVSNLEEESPGLALERLRLLAREGAWPSSLSVPEGMRPCQRRGEEVSASLGIPSLSAKPLSACHAPGMSGNISQAGEEAPPAPRSVGRAVR